MFVTPELCLQMDIEKAGIQKGKRPPMCYSQILLWNFYLGFLTTNNFQWPFFKVSEALETNALVKHNKNVLGVITMPNCYVSF